MAQVAVRVPEMEPVCKNLEDCWDEPVPTPGPIWADLEALQGAWEYVSAPRPALLLVCGSHFTVHFHDGAIYIGSLELDPLSQPRLMRMQIHAGPAQHNGQAAVCLYEIDHDTLRWCTAGPGQLDCPSSFAAAEDGRHLSLVFRRLPAGR